MLPVIATDWAVAAPQARARAAPPSRRAASRVVHECSVRICSVRRRQVIVMKLFPFIRDTSSRTRLNLRFPDSAPGASGSVPEVVKLQRHIIHRLAQRRNRSLQVVTFCALHTHDVALNTGLYLEFAFLDDLLDPLAQLA